VKRAEEEEEEEEKGEEEEEGGGVVWEIKRVSTVKCRGSSREGRWWLTWMKRWWRPTGRRMGEEEREW